MNCRHCPRPASERVVYRGRNFLGNRETIATAFCMRHVDPFLATLRDLGWEVLGTTDVDDGPQNFPTRKAERPAQMRGHAERGEQTGEIMAHPTAEAQQAQTWDTYHREMSGIGAQLIGAAKYISEHDVSDEFIAETFRKYAARFGAVEVPA